MNERPEPIAPTEILRRLIRFDTSNPPGNERSCVDWIASVLASAEIVQETYSADPQRPNLVARLPGRGDAPPLLLYGHVDVVPVAGQKWSHPPFGAEIAHGFIWGRGALDMKGGVAMMITALLELKRSGDPPPGDVILAILSDEEAGGHTGAGWLTERRRELFAGVRHALGEFGGFSYTVSGRRFYPIMVAEKEHCRVRVRITGTAGHGSMPVRGGVAARLGEVLARLERPLPVHVIPLVRQTIESMADRIPFPQRIVLRALARPRLAPGIMRAIPSLAAPFSPLLRNTVAVTIVRAGEKINVVPGEGTIELDGRLLPGHTTDGLVAELRKLLGPGATIEAERDTPAPRTADTSQLPLLGEILQRLDPEAVTIPYLLPAATDARHFARLGIQTYGFTPMRLPADFPFMQLIHAADERIPVDAVEFGARAMVEAVRGYRG